MLIDSWGHADFTLAQLLRHIYASYYFVTPTEVSQLGKCFWDRDYCLNGGTCIEDRNSKSNQPSCKCVGRWSGARCELGKNIHVFMAKEC